MEKNYIDNTGAILIGALLFSLIVAGYITFKSIDFDVLKKLEAQPLVLPTPIITQPQTSTSSVEQTSN